MKIVPILLLSLLSPAALAAGFPVFESKLKGIHLVELSINQDGFLEEIFEDRSNELFQHCNGKRAVYLNAQATPVICTSDSKTGSDRIVFHSKNKQAEGLAVISTSKLLNQVQVSAMQSDDLETLKDYRIKLRAQVEKQAKQQYLKAAPEANSQAYVKLLKNIKQDSRYLKYSRANYTVNTNNGKFYVMPIGLQPDILGWDLENYVFRQINGQFEVIGSFSGCIERFMDVNNDGIPEVLSATCEDNESSSSQLWLFYPSIRSIAARLGG